MGMETSVRSGSAQSIFRRAGFFKRGRRGAALKKKAGPYQAPLESAPGKVQTSFQ